MSHGKAVIENLSEMKKDKPNPRKKPTPATKEKQLRYAYNTRTGSTLWEEQFENIDVVDNLSEMKKDNPNLRKKPTPATKEKQQRYTYNTRTDSTLLVEQGRTGKSKKKPTPNLTVEAKSLS